MELSSIQGCPVMHIIAENFFAFKNINNTNEDNWHHYICIMKHARQHPSIIWNIVLL